MAEAKRTRAKSTKNTPKDDLVEMAATAVETAESATRMEPAAPKALPVADEAALSTVREQSDSLRRAMSQALAVSAQSALEVNGKILEALQTQSNAAIDLWRTALDVSSLPETFDARTAAARQAYETASAQWQDVAQTAARWFTRSLAPFQPAVHR